MKQPYYSLISSSLLFAGIHASYTPGIGQDWTELKPEGELIPGALTDYPSQFGVAVTPYTLDDNGVFLKAIPTYTHKVEVTITTTSISTLPKPTKTADVIRQIHDGQIQRGVTTISIKTNEAVETAAPEVESDEGNDIADSENEQQEASKEEEEEAATDNEASETDNETSSGSLNEVANDSEQPESSDNDNESQDTEEASDAVSETTPESNETEESETTDKDSEETEVVEEETSETDNSEEEETESEVQQSAVKVAKKKTAKKNDKKPVNKSPKKVKTKSATKNAPADSKAKRVKRVSKRETEEDEAEEVKDKINEGEEENSELAEENDDAAADDVEEDQEEEEEYEQKIEEGPVLAVACASDSTLAMTLQGSVLKDSSDRIGSIVESRQFQFDGPVPQFGAIYAAGWSITQEGHLALGNETKFYQCASGDFYNLYDASIGEQCNPVTLDVVDLIQC